MTQHNSGYQFSGMDPIDWPPFRMETLRKWLAASAHEFGISGALLQPEEYQVMAGLPIGDLFVPPPPPGVTQYFLFKLIGIYSQRVNIYKEIRKDHDDNKKYYEEYTSLVKTYRAILIDALGPAPNF